jgi:SAM-dependent methyltransferase
MRCVVNVGTGSYEPPGRAVVAVEPSAVMRAQQPPGAAPCLAAAAERLPFADQCFDAAVSVLSDQHWADPLAGLAEMARVARRVVVLQFDTSDPGRFWLTRDYREFAQLTEGVPTLAERAATIGARLEVVPVPGDCADGFFHAYWRRPHAYLRPEVRRATSAWAKVGPAAGQRAIGALRDDLLTGRWGRRNAGITGLGEMDPVPGCSSPDHRAAASAESDEGSVCGQRGAFTAAGATSPSTCPAAGRCAGRLRCHQPDRLSPAPGPGCHQRGHGLTCTRPFKRAAIPHPGQPGFPAGPAAAGGQAARHQ